MILDRPGSGLGWSMQWAGACHRGWNAPLDFLLYSPSKSLRDSMCSKTACGVIAIGDQQHPEGCAMALLQTNISINSMSWGPFAGSRTTTWPMKPEPPSVCTAR